MTTAGAKKHMEKVLDFVTERMESKSSIYGTTKDQLLEIAKLGRDISDMITDNIDSIPTRGEPKNTTNFTLDDIRKLINEVCDERDRNRKSAKDTDKSAEKNAESTEKPEEESAPVESDFTPETEITPTPENGRVKQALTLSKTKDKKEHISPFAAKSVLRSYAKVLERSAKQTSDMPINLHCLMK